MDENKTTPAPAPNPPAPAINVTVSTPWWQHALTGVLCAVVGAGTALAVTAYLGQAPKA